MYYDVIKGYYVGINHYQYNDKSSGGFNLTLENIYKLNQVIIDNFKDIIIKKI